jgi:pimeloyl-ACP methyl ester carboxylesterase
MAIVGAALAAALPLAVVPGALTGPVHASTNTNATPLDLASSMADPSVVTGASYITTPPSGTPNAVMTTPLAGFPTSGSSYALLTTGNANLANQPNSSASSGANDGGGNVRGNTDYDVTVLKVDLNVPTGVNCLLGLDFRFLSEEYPEFVGTSYNDAFIAELDKSTWTTSGSTITAPDNFAFDPKGNPITINAAGVTSMTAEEASDTTYDGATPLLTAVTPITPGSHSIYLSIFDQGDQIYDSAVMLDNLRLGTVANVAKDCVPGAKPAGGPQAQVLFVHGVDESASDNVFSSLFDKVATAVPGVKINHYDYFQDKVGSTASGCDPLADSQQPVTIPSATAGLPYDASQNAPPRCDSEGDIGQNAFRLDQKIRQMYQSTGQKVILVGYSMGGEAIRSFLAYSASVNDGVASGMVDSVVTMHGVQQGSWVALGAPALAGLPSWLGTPIDGFIHNWAPNPGRLATQQFNPRGDYIHWVHGHSANLPEIPYYNTWGDERVSIQHCYLPFHHACVDIDTANWGDVVLLPGTDSPTQNTLLGGERFLPKGYTGQSWQWDELNRVNWNPLTDPLEIGALASIVSAPQQHSNIPHEQSQITVKDCQTGASVRVDEELARVIIARVNGSTYTCNTALAP